MSADGIQICQSCINLDRVAQNQSVALSILRHICQMIFDGFLYSIQLYFFAVDIQFAADIGAIAFSEQAHGQFRTARTHQSRDTYYFAFSDIEVNVIHYLTV